jgi:hypothetical protein
MALEGILLDETPNHWSPEREEYLGRLARKIRGLEGIVGNRLVSGDFFISPELRAKPARSKLGFLHLISCLIPSKIIFLLSALGVGDTIFRQHHASRFCSFYFSYISITYISIPTQIIHNPGTPPDYGLAPPPAPFPSTIKSTPITTDIEPDKDASSPTYGPDIILTCEEPHAQYLSSEVQRRLEEYYYPPSRSGYMISGVPLGEIAEVVQDLKGRGRYVFATDLVDDFYESFGESWNDFVAAVEGG